MGVQIPSSNGYGPDEHGLSGIWSIQPDHLTRIMGYEIDENVREHVFVVHFTRWN